MPTPPKRWDEFPLALTYGVTPVDPRRAEIGVYLLVDGEVIRYRMPVASARQLAEMLGDYLELGGDTRDHSETSLGSPSFDVSMPVEGQ